jgi:hypothetical protein
MTMSAFCTQGTARRLQAMALSLVLSFAFGLVFAVEFSNDDWAHTTIISGDEFLAIGNSVDASDAWQLRVGKRSGKSEYFYSGTLGAEINAQSVDTLPVNGKAVHVWLQWLIRGKWYSQDLQFIATF